MLPLVVALLLVIQPSLLETNPFLENAHVSPLKAGLFRLAPAASIKPRAVPALAVVIGSEMFKMRCLTTDNI